MTIATLGPNCNAPSHLLSPQVILCSGEDPSELAGLFSRLLNADVRQHHHYRCYQFWKYPDVTLICSAMGTGCIEPLLWEILAPKVIKRIVLFGTAGRLPQSFTKLGQAYVVSSAFLGATALDAFHDGTPLLPRFELQSNRAPTASIVSTDLYYGFSNESLTGAYPIGDRKLPSLVREFFATADLVDMESAQFYLLCGRMGGLDLQYVAVKGPSNTIGVHDEQVENSPRTIESCAQLVVQLLAHA